MRHLLTILAALLLCAAPAQAQTLKALSFNTSSGVVVANTGTNKLTFNDDVRFAQGDFVINSSGAVSWQSDIVFEIETRTLFGPWNFDEPGAVRANLGFSTNLNTLWTATNSSNARSAIGLGATWLTNTNVTNFRAAIGLGATNDVSFNSVNVTNAAATRANIGLPLSALTNTSNVTLMRALAGTTNTNMPLSGTMIIDPANIYEMVVSNGIILDFYVQ